MMNPLVRGHVAWDDEEAYQARTFGVAFMRKRGERWASAASAVDLRLGLRMVFKVRS